MIMEFDLPEDIIHHIQYFMGGKQAARTCLLSRLWYHAWSTRPILAFDVAHPRDSKDYGILIRESIGANVMRYKESSIRLHKLDLRFSGIGRYIDEYDGLVDGLIRDASELGVNQLHLAFSKYLHVPAKVFAITSLTELSIHGGWIKKLPLDTISPLLSLHLNHVNVGKEDYTMIQDILLRCPSIENLKLEGFEEGGLSINIGKLHNLVYLHVHNWRGTSEVAFTNGGRVNSCVSEFHKLRSISLKGVKIKGGFFINYSSRFPCIEDLSLDRCTGYDEGIQISSNSLKYLKFVLHPYEKVKKAEFDVPNICKFVFKMSHNIPTLSFSTVSREWESELELPCSLVGTSWFIKLRELLKELCSSRITLRLSNVDRSQVISAIYFPDSPTPHVENLTVNDYHPQAQALVSTLFGCCRPTFITLRLLSNMSKPEIIGYVQHVHELFAHWKNTRKCFSSSMQSLIMYHIKEIDLQLYEELEWQTIELGNFVQHILMFPLNGDQIRFWLKWGTSNVLEPS